MWSYYICESDSGAMQGNLLLSFPSCLCSLSPSPHHLWRLTTMREGSHEEHQGPICWMGLCMRCGDVRMRGDQIGLMAWHIWHGPPVKRRTRWDPHCTDMHTETYVHTLIPGVCPPPRQAKWCSALIFTLWVNTSLRLSLSFSLFFHFFLLHFLCLPPCSRLDGWPDSLGVFRFWRDPNFLF